MRFSLGAETMKRVLVAGVLLLGFAYGLTLLGNKVTASDFAAITAISVDQNYSPNRLAIIGGDMVERGFYAAEVVDSIKVLISDKHHPDNIADLINASADFAKIENGNLLTYTRRVSRGFKTPEDIREFDYELNFMKAEEYSRMRELEREYDYIGAKRIALSAFQRRVSMASRLVR